MIQAVLIGGSLFAGFIFLSRLARAICIVVRKFIG